MFRVLSVEDSKDMQDLIQFALFNIAHVRAAPSLKRAHEIFSQEEFDLILMDVELEDGDGFSLTEQLRQSKKGEKIPVIFFTSKAEIIHKEKGFGLGAEDYIVKPCDPREIRLRVESRLQKIRDKNETNELHDQHLYIDVIKQKAFFLPDKKEIKLTPLQFKILHCLMKNPNSTVSREKLMEEIWGSAETIGRSVDAHVSALRRKLVPHEEKIQSVYGCGYIFKTN